MTINIQMGGQRVFHTAPIVSAAFPSTALIGEIVVWRAANGINPQDPQPTGGTQLETLPAPWKQRLDRDIERATYRIWLFSDQGASLRSAGGACPRCAAGRAASCAEPR